MNAAVSRSFVAFCVTVFVLQQRAVKGVDGRIVRWIPNTDFDNPKNWATGRVPCRNEHVRFPASVASVFVQRNNTVMEIVLPYDGELVLGEGVALSFPTTPDNDATCPERETSFNGSRPMSWFDLANWCEADDVTCLPRPPRRLHTESIPCAQDNVVFPSGSGFIVDLESHADIRVGMIRIGEQQHTGSTLRQYLDSDVGRRQFVRSSPGGDATATTINVSGEGQCTDPSGCLCGNERLKERICSIQSARCQQQTSCENAITPQGHCCPICGAIMMLRYDPGFQLSVIENLIKDNNQPPTDPESGVWWILSKIRPDPIANANSDSMIQVVLSDNAGGDDAVRAAYVIKQVLQNDAKGSQQYKVIEVRLTVTGSGDNGPEAHSGDITGSARTAAIVVPIMFLMLVVCVVCAVYFLFFRRRRHGGGPADDKGFSFSQVAIWRRETGPTGRGRADMEMGRRDMVFDNIIYEGTITSFDNLTFGNVQPQEFENLEVQPAEGIRSGFNNPIYGTGALQEVSAAAGTPPVVVAEASGEKAGIFAATSRPSAVYEDMNKTRQEVTEAAAGEPPKKSILAGVFGGRMRFDANRQQLKNEEDEDENEGTISGKDGGKAPKGGKSTKETAEKGKAKGKDETTTTKADDETMKTGKSWKSRGGEKKKAKKSMVPRVLRDENGNKHQIFEDSDDSDENSDGDDVDDVNSSSKKSSTAVKVSGGPEKGFGNPCYDDTSGDQRSPRAAVTPVAAAAASSDRNYRTGFANPLFDDPGQTGLTIHGADTGDSQA